MIAKKPWIHSAFPKTHFRRCIFFGFKFFKHTFCQSFCQCKKITGHPLGRTWGNRQEHDGASLRQRHPRHRCGTDVPDGRHARHRPRHSGHHLSLGKSRLYQGHRADARPRRSHRRPAVCPGTDRRARLRHAADARHPQGALGGAQRFNAEPPPHHGGRPAPPRLFRHQIRAREPQHSRCRRACDSHAARHDFPHGRLQDGLHACRRQAHGLQDAFGNRQQKRASHARRQPERRAR